MIENIDEASAGDIIAMVGVDCASDTFVGQEDWMNVSCEGMHVPIPVIELSTKLKIKITKQEWLKDLIDLEEKILHSIYLLMKNQVRLVLLVWVSHTLRFM